MGEISVEQLIQAAKDPQVGLNLDKAGSLFTQADKTLKAAEGWMTLVERGVNLAEKSGMIPGLIRAMGKQYGVDVDTPLKTSNAVMPLSEDHRQVLNAVNGLSPDDLKEAVEVLNRWFVVKRQARGELGDGTDKPQAGQPPG